MVTGTIPGLAHILPDEELKNPVLYFYLWEKSLNMVSSKFIRGPLTLVFLVAVCVAAGQQSGHRLRLNTSIDIQYLLYLPENYHSDTAQEFPLLLFLHGGGEFGDDLDKVKVHGPPKLVEEGKSFPFLILSPQNPDGKKLWDVRAVIALLDTIVASCRVDEERVYLTGLSRGGFGAWMTAIQYPDRFAALIPISGVAPAFYGKWLGQMPIWMFHGEDDPVIPVAESDEMAEVLRQNGNPVRFTRYSGMGHDAWTSTYENPQVFEWMLQQRLPKTGKEGK